jgi:outer membrane cobalamin receptor
VPRFRFLLVFLLAAACGFADNLQIKVLDPQLAVVPGARVAVYPKSTSSPVTVMHTGADGTANVAGLGHGEYRVRVLAGGFAPAEQVTSVNGDAQLTIKIDLPTAAETVVVSTERTPVPSAEAGADTSTISPQTLQAMQPVEMGEAVRFLPGAVVSANGRRGGLASLFVRGGESRYNKVIIDGVSVNDPGGTFDFSVVPMDQVERVEFVRGAERTLYGSDAMTSVIQAWTRTGTTRTPELRFGAEGGTFQTARGYASLAGANGRFDYNLFGDQFNTAGQGVNDAYSNSLEGANLGVALAPRAQFRMRTRHSTARTGVQSFWNFNGHPLLPPDTDARARQNNFLASGELAIAAPARWRCRPAKCDRLF